MSTKPEPFPPPRTDFTRPRWRIAKATCFAFGEDLHFLDDCPQDHSCPVWAMTAPNLRSLYPTKEDSTNGS